MSIDYEQQTDGIACHSINDEGDDFYVGFIKHNSEGYFVINIGRRVTLTCKQMLLIGNKLSDMNKAQRE